MPRFRMSLQDMDDLAAYLQRLGTGSDPGLEDRAVRIGVVLPPAGPLSAMGKTVRAAVTARFEAVNREGGLYGRRLEPRFFEAPEPADQRRGWTADFLQRERIFAAVGAYFAGDDAEMDALFQEERIPVVGPFSLHPREDVPLNRYVFYLLPGLEMQEKALVAFAAGSGWPRPVTLSGAETDVELRRQAAAKADPILFLGSGPAALSLLRGADRAGWHPRVLVTAAAADGSLFAAPAAFEGKLFLGLPAPPDSASAQSAAVAAADVLVEAMKRAGRDLSREKLVDELESLNGFTTGFTPPVTFGAARRLGARGAWIARLDLAHRKTVSAGGWREAE
jgi:ABC-type branched-subunit amino acid transport system substrate-binding protein